MSGAHTSHGSAATAYAWKPHARLKGDAQKVGETVERIRVENGTVSPRLLVEHAKSKDSILHAYFDWNNGSASAKYREVQAAHLLRSIVTVRCSGLPTQTAPTRAFVSVPRAREESENEDEPGSYTSIAEAVRVVDYRQQLMEQALKDLDAYRIKYQLLSDLTGWGSAILVARDALEKALHAAKDLEKMNV
jgi:hypothetical protein